MHALEDAHGSPASSQTAWNLLCVLTTDLHLGDARLDERVQKMAERCLDAASASLNKLFGRGQGALKGAGRLLSNPRASLEKMRDALYSLSFEQAKERKCKRLICAFDPTILDFSSQEKKRDRMRVGNERGQGYVWLNSALIDPDSGRFIGVGHQTLLSGKGPDDKTFVDYATGIKGKRLRKELESNFKQEFLTHARVVDHRAPSELEIVFVADREFDDGLALRSCDQLSTRSHFIIRSNNSRVVQVTPADWLPQNTKKPSAKHRLGGASGSSSLWRDVYLKDIVSHLPLVHAQKLPLDARGRVCQGNSKPVREANLSIGAVRIRLAKRSERGRRARIAEEPVELNLLVVREEQPPRGVTPLLWILLTSLPIDTHEQRMLGAESYGLRWRTEEFFRTTKDAMKVEASRLEDAAATARLLFFITIKAMFLDALRADAQLPAGVPPTNEKRLELRAARDRAERIQEAFDKAKIPPPALSPYERATMVLALIAMEGNWTWRKNDHLGNYVLLYGLSFFLRALAYGRYAWLLPHVQEVGT